MVLVLTATALFVYVRLRADLDESVDERLSARADAVGAMVARAGPDPAAGGSGAGDDAEDGFAQVLDLRGRLLDSAGGARGPVLTGPAVAEAASDSVRFERDVPGIDGTARVLGRSAPGPGGDVVIVVGESLEDRDETLADLIAAFAVGGPLAVVLASLLGYLLAAAGLAPVERMRRRAAEVSLDRAGERLPLPAAHDEVRRLGETLNDMLDRLRRSFERERRFVADASHELRTPVAVLKTELEGALRTGDFGPDVRAALVAAVEECDHLAQLAEDLLVVARSGDGTLPVRREQVAVRGLLADVRERFVDRADRQSRAVRIDAADGLAVSADPLRLRQALGNLTDNALRHGAGEIVLAARRADDGIELDVSDHGPGFAGEIAGTAFERFTRGDETRGRSGTGLGLAIVRAVAEAHGGHAAIVPGRGATVRIWLPEPAQGGLS
jgi:signal transduction histidine kinase